MKELNDKINGLWQSQRDDMGKKGNLWLALILGLMSLFLVIAFVYSSEVIEKILFGYMLFAFGIGAVTLVANYFYIYSKKKIAKWLENILKIIYKVWLIICFLVYIPIFLFLKITELFIKRRARKIDNLENWLIILLIDLAVMMLLGYVNLLVSTKMASGIEFIASIKLNIKVNVYAITLFLSLSLLKAEWEVVNKVILTIMNHYGMSKIKKGLIEEAKGKKAVNYDIAYQKTALWSFQLVCLIFLFFIATFTQDTFTCQSDAINVITVFTLGMLYWDKRRSWDKDVLGLK